MLFRNVTVDAKLAVEWVKNEFNPEDVYDDSALSAWAESNGYVKAE